MSGEAMNLELDYGTRSAKLSYFHNVPFDEFYDTVFSFRINVRDFASNIAFDEL